MASLYRQPEHYRKCYVVCKVCGHQNRPHPKTEESYRLAKAGLLKPCRDCGKALVPFTEDLVIFTGGDTSSWVARS